MIESPPKIRKEDFDKALRLSCDPKIADVVNEINRQYQYWTEIKYKTSSRQSARTRCMGLR